MTQEQGQNVAKQMGATYVECSSKEMAGVHEVFELAVETAVGREIQAKQQKHIQQTFGGGTGAGGAAKMKKSKKRPCQML